MEVGGRNLVSEMIGAAVFSGAYGSLARLHPDAANGLLKLRDKWSARAETLADLTCSGATFPGQAPEAVQPKQ